MKHHLALLIIGNEILSGKVQEANALFAIQELQFQGGISKLEVVLDDRDAIQEAILRLAQQYRFVITSGGVGPTHDDITILSIAEAFQTPRKRDPELAQAIQQHFGQKCNESLLSMADLPEGTEIIYPEKKSFPVFRFRNIFILPGIPEYFRAKFLAIKPQLLSSEVFLRCVYTTFEEGQLAEKLSELELRYSSLRIGSYPKLHKNYQVMITFESTDIQIVESSVRDMIQWLPQEALVLKPDDPSSLC